MIQDCNLEEWDILTTCYARKYYPVYMKGKGGGNEEDRRKKKEYCDRYLYPHLRVHGVTDDDDDEDDGGGGGS